MGECEHIQRASSLVECERGIKLYINHRTPVLLEHRLGRTLYM